MEQALRLFQKKPKIYALVGGSGTGKSFHAKIVAHKYRIKLIIDDGLLIKDERIIAGHSAKDEQSYMGAVRAALFDNEEVKNDVVSRLAAEKSRKILVLGTSTRMVCKIAARLTLPEPRKFIHIEKIAARRDIETALRTRRIEGKHVVPVPQNEVKRKLGGVFFEAIRVRNKKIIPQAIIAAPMHEKSLVRPLYSRRERVKISKEALSQIVFLSVNEFNADIKVKSIDIKTTGDDGLPLTGYRVVIILDLPDGSGVSELIAAIQRYIIGDIEHFTGILIEEINVILDKIV